MRFLGLAGVFLLIAFGGASRAASPDAGQDLTPTARQMSDEALRHYQQAEYDAAIESFMSAFALSNNPGLLFNVAQAYRLKGDCAHAKDYYQRYLTAVPDSPFKPSLERRVAEMETCAANQPPSAMAAAAGATSAPPAAPAPPKPDLVTSAKPEPSPARRAAVWTLRGSAAALLASSAVFGALTWNAYRDVDSAPTQRTAWDAADRYHTDSALAWTFAASGLACAIVSYVVGRQR